MTSGAASMRSTERSSGSLFGISLPVQMLIGLGIGCVIGSLWPIFGKELLPLGQVFVKALRMVVIALVFASIALGVYNMGREIGVVGRVVGIAFVWFYLATGLCVIMGRVMNEIFHPGICADLTIPGGKVPANAGLSVEWVQFLIDLVPANIVSAMAEQKILQVLLFGMLLGGALSTMGEVGRPVIGVLHGVQVAMMKMVRWIIAFAPLAVAATMAWLLSTQGTGALYALAKLVGTLYIGLAVVILLMCLVLLGIGENPWAVIRKIAEPLLLAFTTRSSEVTLPIHMEILERIGVPNKVVSTVIPLGYSFNQDGTSLYVSLAVAFVVEAHNIHLGVPALLTIIVAGLITTKGMGNVGGGGLIAATTAPVAMGLPVEAIALVAGIDAFMDMGRTTVNVMGNTVAVVLVRKFGLAKDDEALPAPRGA